MDTSDLKPFGVVNATTSAARIKEPKMGHVGLRPVFVVGCMRSGTTILGKLLDSHPGLKQIGWEMNDEWTTLGCAPSGIVCEPRHAQDASLQARDAMRDFFIKKMGINAICMRPVNKSPHLGNKIAYVRALFPDAQFVHIIRDPFSHTNSMMSHLERVTYRQRQSVVYWPEDGDKPCWQQFTMEQAAQRDLDMGRIYPGEGFYRIPEAWAVINAYISETLRALPKNVATAISYNRLVVDPETEIARLYGFLSLDTQQATRAPDLMNGTGKLVNSQTRDPLNEWRSTLAPKLVSEIENQLNVHATQFDRIERWLKQSYGNNSLSVLPLVSEVHHDER
jgi:hypothetical protein